jgi:hypothetical protein
MSHDNWSLRRYSSLVYMLERIDCTYGHCLSISLRIHGLHYEAMHHVRKESLFQETIVKTAGEDLPKTTRSDTTCPGDVWDEISSEPCGPHDPMLAHKHFGQSRGGLEIRYKCLQNHVDAIHSSSQYVPSYISPPQPGANHHTNVRI